VGGSGERRFLIVAGEASGDLLAARLVSALRALGPCRVRGVTGPALAAAGAERVVPVEDLAVIGFSGVVARLPRIWSAYRRLLAEARAFRPQAAVLVDSPGFNFRAGPALRRLGIPVFYYVAPQVWAWHAERAAAMARWVDRLAVILPFEEELFRRAGVDARFVGHPLLEELEPEVDATTLRAETGLAAGGTLLGLLPGSRPQELRAHAPVMAAAARRLCAERPGLVAALALAPGLGSEAAALGGALAGVRVLPGRARAVQAHAACCAVASGTATLETALFGTPEAIVYRTGWLNYAIARRVIRLPHIGLPNIIAGREVAPELIQGDLTPGRLAAALAPWLDDEVERARVRAGLGTVRERLGGPGASARAAAWLWEMVG
jgi:lipid-A-disaccharide synthase